MVKTTVVNGEAKHEYVEDKPQNTFAVTMVNGRVSFINGNNIKDIFGTIDGLRLQGKRWLKTFDFEPEIIHEVYINIDHIVSIE